MGDFESGSASGANLNGNGKNNGNFRYNKPPTNEIASGKPLTGTYGNIAVPPTTIINNSNGNGGTSRKATNSLQPVPTPPPGSNSGRRQNNDPVSNENTRNNTVQVALSGTLSAFSPSSILSLLNIQKQTGALVISTNGASGYIYVKEGEVWHARLGTIMGAYALFQLFGWKQGQFSFEIQDSVPPKRTIDASLPVLQVRATLWLDNMNKYNQLIPSVSHRIFIANDPPGGVIIEPYQWAILTKIVARPLSIAQLAEELDQDLMTVTRIAADLVRMGIAVVKPPESLPDNFNTNGRG